MIRHIQRAVGSDRNTGGALELPITAATRAEGVHYAAVRCENCHAIVAEVGHVDAPAAANGDAERGAQVTGASTSAAPRAKRGPVSLKALDAIVELVYDEYGICVINGHAERRVELARAAAGATPLREHRSVRTELHHAVQCIVAD